MPRPWTSAQAWKETTGEGPARPRTSALGHSASLLGLSQRGRFCKALATLNPPVLPASPCRRSQEHVTPSAEPPSVCGGLQSSSSLICPLPHPRASIKPSRAAALCVPFYQMCRAGGHGAVTMGGAWSRPSKGIPLRKGRVRSQESQSQRAGSAHLTPLRDEWESGGKLLPVSRDLEP